MKHTSQEKLFFLNIKEYLRNLEKVAGQKKLILTFCLLFGVVGTIIMMIGLFFTIHWIVGVIVTVISIGYFSLKLLFDSFYNDIRD